MPGKAPVISTPEIAPNAMLTYAQVAGLFGVSERQVRRWVEERKLDHTPLPGGRGRRISGQQYLDYIHKHAVAASN